MKSAILSNNTDFAAMVRRASTAGLTTLNQLRVFLWLGRQTNPVTARQCADGTGVQQSQALGIFKALESQGHVSIEVSVEFSYGIRRSQLVVQLTSQGLKRLESILREEVAA